MLKKRLQELIEIVEASNVNEIEVSTWWGQKIRISKSGPGRMMAPELAAVQTVPPASALSEPTEPLAAEKQVTQGKEVLAPVVGTYYSAPSPDSPSYLRVGDKVSVGQVFCIIEAMKIMNEIECDVSGTVIDILIENATPVEYNQALIIVDPS